MFRSVGGGGSLRFGRGGAIGVGLLGRRLELVLEAAVLREDNLVMGLLGFLAKIGGRILEVDVLREDLDRSDVSGFVEPTTVHGRSSNSASILNTVLEDNVVSVLRLHSE